MTRHKAKLLWAAAHEVAEGPFWDAHGATVSWVDITGGELWQSQLHPWEPSVVRFDGTLAAAIPRSAGGFVLCLSGEIVLTDPIGAVVSRTTVLTDASLRFNDAKCDSAGRLWAGTTAVEFTEGGGALYRHDGTTPELVAEGLVLPNGLGWSPDDTRFYLVDSMRNQILHAAFDAESGKIGELSVAFKTTGGLPDGLCVDSTGMLWVAFWGGGVVRQFTPGGRQLASIDVPAQQCSSCCIVNDTLCITTARSGLSAEEIAAEPLAGSLFTAAVDGLQGVPLHRAAF